MRWTTITWALAVLVVGCNGTDGGAPDGPGMNNADAFVAPYPGVGVLERWKFELMREDRSFSFNLQTGGAEAWTSFFAPDGAKIRAGVGEIRGREAIEAMFREAVVSGALVRLAWEPERAEVSNGGDLGYTVGTYRTINQDSAGGQTTVVGKYVSIWRRQEDGGWKVEMDLGNPLSEPEVITPDPDMGDLGIGAPGQGGGAPGKAAPGSGGRTP